MNFGVIINRKMIDRTSSDPYGRLFSYLNEMEDLGYDLGWCGHHRFSEATASGGESATEPSAPLAILAPLLARTRHMKFCTNIMLVTPTGVPDPEQQIKELRIFAREVMSHFRTD